MPETPDFDHIARNMITPIDGDDDERRQLITAVVADIAEQLRLAWNARGAADIAKLQTELSMLMGSTMAGPYVSNLDRAMRTLDR
jgi:hypothetical protein